MCWVLALLNPWSLSSQKAGLDFGEDLGKLTFKKMHFKVCEVTVLTSPTLGREQRSATTNKQLATILKIHTLEH